MSAPSARSGQITDLVVDDAGLLIRGDGDFPLDVCFDGRRIFSFWLQRDTQDREGRRWFGWPPVLDRFLDGQTTVSLVDPTDGTELASVAAVLGGGEGEIRVEDRDGNPMALDKSMRMSRLFGSRDPEHMIPLLDAMDTVLGALEAAGLEPFIAYGTLLGAVRDRDFIGHDSDADLGYVSAYDHPTDAVRESFRVQRRVQQMGFQVQRYSGLAFKVIVPESDGGTRGLDVFGGLLRDGMLYLMGEVGHPFRREWLLPRTTATLAGRDFPVPAVPEHLLEAMYGPTWRVPDPAYQFTTPRETTRRLNGWFRGIRVGFDARWVRFRARTEPVRLEPSSMVETVYRELPEGAGVIDVGCARGRDLMYLGRRGVRGIGLDYFQVGFRPTAERAVEEGLPVRFDYVNLGELRSVIPAIAELAREPGPRIMMARHVADATDRRGRIHLLRMARALTRDTGRLYLQFQTVATEQSEQAGLKPVPIETMRGLIEDSGGVIESLEELDEHQDGTAETAPSEPGPTICRMVVSWKR